ncbi:MAG: kinase [Candidatus Auribacterota bacterium]|nr:kinase [Candidatus Auribacterota bacterium]
MIENRIFSEFNYRNLTNRNKIDIVRRGCLNTPALVAYDSIPERFKQKVRKLVGDPYKAATKSSLADYITPDEKARVFFRDYLMDNGDHLPEPAQKEYTTNAEILNALHAVVSNREAKRKAIGGKLSNVWVKLAEAVLNLDKTVFKHTLPPNYRRLQDRYNQYKATDNSKYDRIGYESLIHGNWCNKNSEKINDMAKSWILARWTSMVDRIATEQQLFNEYNFLAESQEWKTLKSVDAIHNFLYSEEIKPLWWAARYGELKFKEKFAYQNKTILPTMRDSLWYSDGTKLNYFYQYRDAQGHFQIGTTSVYEIVDVYSEFLVGYHISDSENYVTQYSAYRMALEVSGYKPYQVSYDNQGGHKKLETGDFLTKLSHLSIRTKPYNGKSKTIENLFYRYQSQFLKKDWFFTGQNIQSKKEESKANMEFIMANKHNLPTREEIPAIYKQRRNEWNNAPHPQTGHPRIEMYRQSKNPKAVKLELMDMVDMFWILREKPVQLTAYGIQFEERGVKYLFDIVEPSGLPDVRWIARNIDRKFRIKFDPQDFSMIYLYEDTPQGLRFIREAVEPVRIHRGKQEQEAGEMERWCAIDKAIDEMREEIRAELMNIQQKHNQLPEQHGLITPAIKGIKRQTGEGKKQKQKQAADNFGRLQKAISNVVMAGDDDGFDESELWEMV